MGAFKKVIGSCALATILVLVGCGGTSSGDYDAANYSTSETASGYASDYTYGDDDFEWEETTEAEREYDVDDAESGSVAIPQGMVRREISASLLSRDYDKADAELTTLVHDYGVVVLEDYSYGGNYEYAYRNRDIAMRVEPQRVDELVEELKSSESWDCGSIRVSADDVSKSYQDTERRIESLELKYEFYKSQLEKTEDPDLVRQYSNWMFETLSDIERLRSDNSEMMTDVNFSYVSISLSEDTSLEEIDNSTGLWDEMVDQFTVLPRNVAAAFGFLLLFIIEALPYALVLLAVIALVRFILSKTESQREAYREKREQTRREAEARRAEQIAYNRALRDGIPPVPTHQESISNDVAEED